MHLSFKQELMDKKFPERIRYLFLLAKRRPESASKLVLKPLTSKTD